jgi:plasmid replication initiation protein
MSVFGGSAGEIHTQLDFATTALMKRVVKIETEKGWDKFQWVSHSRLIRGSSIIEIQFHEMMAPYISEMKKCFTKIELPQLAGFTSSHALRIYENMLRWDTETCLEITVEDLKKMLGLYDEKKKTFDYPRFFDFEKKVLKQAENQIKLYTPHILKYQKIGKRGPSGIRFIKFFLTFKNKSRSKESYENLSSVITQLNGEVSEQPSLFASDSASF